MTAAAEDDNLVYSPTPLLPEIFLDLDLMLLTAVDDDAYRSAIAAGTREVISRFEHLADPRVFCASAKSVVAEVAAAINRLTDMGDNRVAQWLTTEVLDLLVAQEQLHERCIDTLRAAGDIDICLISEVVSSIEATAANVRDRRFAPLPECCGNGWDYNVKLAVLAAMSAEMRRNPLRKQLDGAGGAAGSAEFNPYVRAMFELELVTHRRLYRILYSLAEHVGVDLRGDELFQAPEVVENQKL
ncbi:hypothetical protein [Mycolicibacterium iranicum]|uniref:Uncharacterized protein n=1 Tax=Mycolicibacterium iranicum TaxID=912594 RepID=A0A1X1WA19_MYCIR|nr:hypothetical protein [Mycolicibacterium iranicum]ORV83453.1 hypothetical protein AWC12_26240 [Mycolicibacterium iranicum]